MLSPSDFALRGWPRRPADAAGGESRARLSRGVCASAAALTQGPIGLPAALAQALSLAHRARPAAAPR